MNKQVYKNVNLSRTKVKNNILKIWAQTYESERFDWYECAHNFAKNNTKNEVELSKFIGVIAALSPLKSWSQNKTLAYEVYNGKKTGHMVQFINKALNILNSDGKDCTILDILKGNKISSFYLNIRYFNDFQHVTIDRHALSIALGHKITNIEYSGITSKQYNFFVQCYIFTAKSLKINPLLLQSSTWVKYRTLKKDEL